MSSEDDEDENILAKEVESWKGFEYALRKPNATLFNEMLKECLENEEYTSASKNQRTTVFHRIIVCGFNIPTTKNDKWIDQENRFTAKNLKVKDLTLNPLFEGDKPVLFLQ